MKNYACLLMVLFTINFCLLSKPSHANFGANGIHDPSSIIKLNGVYHIWGTGNQISHLTSTDMVNWVVAPSVFASGTWPAYINTYVSGFAGFFWAPECFFMNGQYYMYYSCSTGGRPCVIGVATSTDLINWTDQGLVVNSTTTTTYGCIDPAVFADAKNNIWLVFGSHLNGNFIAQLNPVSGKMLNGTITNIAGSTNCQNEASYVIANGNYFYLFYNVGTCCAGKSSTYNVKMGRATSPTGPYLDKAGVALLSTTGGTQSLATSGKYIGPGHYGLFKENGRNYISMHYYDSTSNGYPRLDIATMIFGADGWPIVTRDLLPPTRYTVTNTNSGFLWYANGCSGMAGQQLVQAVGDTAAICQRWDLTSQGDGFYQLQNAKTDPVNNSAQVIDVPYCNTDNGSLLASFFWLNNNCQKFKIDKTAAGAYVFSPAANSDKVIEVPNNSMVAGTQLSLNDYGGNTGQLWNIQPTINNVPVATTATNISYFSFTANWTAVPNATCYNLDVFTDNGAVFGYSNLSVTGTSQVVKGMFAGVNYYYVVRAVFSSNTASQNSNTIALQTPYESIDNGAHDPSTIVRQGNKYFMYATGFTSADGTVVPLALNYSTDLYSWTKNYKPLFPNGVYPAWINTMLPGFGGLFWAPDIIFMNGKYYMYYAASIFGKSTSVIGLATSPTLDPNSPDFLWTDQGMVVSSTTSSQPNAIDPALLKDTDGRLYLYYGSYSAGIVGIELDSISGLVKSGASNTLLAGGAKAAWEAAYMVKEGAYYYLFVNRQYCCALLKSTYYIVVGRSTNAMGPFLDKSGNSLVVTGNGTVVGTTVLASSGKYIGPGHFALLRDSGRYVVSMHYYDATSWGYPRLGTGELKFSDDGWPVVTRDMVPNGRYKIANVNSGLVLETGGCTGNTGQPINQNIANDSSLCQQWDLTGVGDGLYQMRNAKGAQVIDIPFCNTNNKLATYNWLGNDCQKYQIDKLANGSFVFSPASNTGVVFDVPSASTAPNTQIGLWNYNAGPWQKWNLNSYQGVPIAFSADSISATSFVAKWSPAPGANTYKLDVSTSPNFTAANSTLLAGWDFSNRSSAADSGIAINIGKTLISGGGVGTTVYSFPANGTGGFTAMASGWDSGMVKKYWEATNIVTTGYYNLRVASKQSSNTFGPRHFKLQYKLDLTGLYTDVPGSHVATADNYTSAVLSNIALPSNCDNKPSVYLRWIMISNANVGNATDTSAGGTLSAGISNIDDINITGYLSPGNSFVPGYQDLTVSGTSQLVKGLLPNTTYYYRIRSIINGVTSNSSNVRSVTTSSAPMVVLPVQLNLFDVQKLSSSVKIYWATGQEINTDYFTVQQSIDGVNWKAKATVKAQGFSISSRNYEAIDKTPDMGINFYRLKEVDKNGVTNYSNIRSVTFDANSNVLVTPNPASDFINVTVFKNTVSMVRIYLFDINGVLVHQYNTNNKSLQINTSLLPKGVYLLKVDSDNKISMQKVIIL